MLFKVIKLEINLHGNRKAPPPFSRAVNGNLQTFPNPTDREMQDSKNSTSFVQRSRFDDCLST